MNVTVNGKSLLQIQEELEAPFSEAEMVDAQGGGKAIPIGAYEDRLNQVLGVMNYDFITSEGRLETIGDRHMLHVSARITVYDDARRPIVTKSACGGCNVIIVNQTGQPKSLKSDLDSAVSEAYKNCCQKLNVGVKQLREKNKKTNRNQDRDSRGNQNPDMGNKTGSTDGKRVKVRLMQSLQSGNKNYYAKAAYLDTGEQVVFKLFEREYPAFEQKIAIRDFVARCGNNTEMNFVGKESSFKGSNQIIFVNW